MATTRVSLCSQCTHAVHFPESLPNPDEVFNDATDVHNAIAETERRQEILRQEIRRLSGILHQLEDQQQKEVKFHAHCGSMLAPIRSLPLELLSTIFEFVCHVDCSGNFPCQLFNELKVPMFVDHIRLLEVCRLWRKLALATPSLFATIFINIDRSSKKELNILNRLLTLSGTSPLHVFIRQSKWDPSGFCEELVAVSHRIEHLHFQGKKDPFSGRWSPPTFPLLTAFDFSAMTADYPDVLTALAWLPSLPWIASAPNLRSVQLAYAGGVSKFRSNLPGKQIKFLSNDDYSPRYSMQILRRLPNLQFASLGNAYSDDGSEPSHQRPNPGLRLAHLTALKIRSCDPEFDDPINIQQYLKELTLPALTELSLWGDNAPLTWSFVDFDRFLSRSNIRNTVTCLELQGRFDLPNAAEDLIGTIKLLLSLRKLALFEFEGHMLASTELLHRLDVTSPNRLLLKLEELECCFQDGPERVGLLVGVVKSRAPGSCLPRHVSAMKRVSLALVTQTGEESIEELEDCRALGIIVDVEVASRT